LDQTFAAKNQESYYISDPISSDTDPKLIPKKTKIGKTKLLGEIGTREHSHV
jgi:hypothetical protein